MLLRSPGPISPDTYSGHIRRRALCPNRLRNGMSQRSSSSCQSDILPTMVGPSKSRPPMSHRKTDLGIPCRSKSAKVVLAIELLEVAVNAPLAERDASLRGEIRGNPRPLGHALVQRDDARHLALEPLHPSGEGVAQALDDLEQREVRIGELAADEIGAAAVGEHAFEIAQEFRQAIAPEI